MRSTHAATRLAVVGAVAATVGAASIIGAGDASAWATKSGHPATIDTSGGTLTVTVTNPFTVPIDCAAAVFPRSQKDKAAQLASHTNTMMAKYNSGDYAGAAAENAAADAVYQELIPTAIGGGQIDVPASSTRSEEVQQLPVSPDQYTVLSICRADLNGEAEDEIPAQLDADAQVFNPGSVSTGPDWGSVGDLLPDFLPN